MEWSDEYKVGLSVVDSQYKRLFSLMAELEEALQGTVEIDVVEEILGTLEQYKSRHFQMEEKYMTESAYPGLEEQRQAHASFDKRFREIGGLLAEKGPSSELLGILHSELGEWLKNHVTSLDLEFGKYYKEYESK